MSVVSSSQGAVVGSTTAVATDASTVASRVADYTEMCRPRIAVMTMVAVSAGFILASPILINWSGLVVALLGILQLVASSSILNQVLEKQSDAGMARTADRPLVQGRISTIEATIVGTGLGLSGATILWVFTNPATTLAGIGTLLTYVCAYTPLKTRSTLCTTIGAIPGAMPPVLGWLAAGGAIGSGAWALFALLFTWQFPHFLAIGWIYRKDYEQAGLKMLPSFSDNGRRAGLVAIAYALAFIPVSMIPAYAGLTGSIYFVVALVLSCTYFVATLRFSLSRTTQRGRELLLISLVILPILLLVMVGEFLHLTALG